MKKLSRRGQGEGVTRTLQKKGTRKVNLVVGSVR